LLFVFSFSFSFVFPFLSFFLLAFREFDDILEGHFLFLNFFTAIRSKVPNLSIGNLPPFIQTCPLFGPKATLGANSHACAFPRLADTRPVASSSRVGQGVR
jgi:hypothetical protein